MGLLSLTPTFTQGFILGQVSVLVFLGYVLRYLFFDTTGPQPVSTGDDDSQDDQAEGEPSDLPNLFNHKAQRLHLEDHEGAHLGMPDYVQKLRDSSESLEWLNFLLARIAQSYREALRRGPPMSGGDEVARMRIERWSPVKVHSVSLGTSAPKLSNARVVRSSETGEAIINFDLLYTDTLSMTLSTSFLFNYPSVSFARLPISLSISLSLFSAVVTISPPTFDTPSFTLSLRPDFSLSLTQSSLMGSRAKLSDVPKVHQMIADRIKAAFLAKAKAYRVALPGTWEHSDVLGKENTGLDVYVES
ncbi:uncharacterized protein EI90DRAFT_3119035 [Cantharellus anzutake]|uniref:uncharacterized protein n=1 Tax=Cantharellus anzutake TaxID=1750568 RepID=UPI001907FABB|nr:uncharacterized protein EI90DRAFT_3119035 [Cantharellus anzutake]KAF8337588.1 hypothetical protein EI90DRAFT_3119035 [Cantharellus anzutake]